MMQPEHTHSGERPSKVVALVILPAMLVLVLVVLGRVFGPSDLFQNTDQSKTAAFTADMVYNGRWLIPVDLTGASTLKPPLYNWLGAPVLAIGWHSELAYKLPSLIAGIATMGLTAAAGRMLFRRLGQWSNADPVDRAIATHAIPLGIVAGTAWLASTSSVKHIYFSRPDGLHNTLLTVGWLAACILLLSPKPPRLTALVLWLAAGLAALTKGPMALLLPAFVVLGFLLVRTEDNEQRRWRTAGLWWGLPLMLAIPAAWLIPAYWMNPEHIGGTLLGSEVGQRISTGGDGLGRLPLNAIRVPSFYFERFWPWSFGALFALLIIRPRRWLSHPLAPAVLWILMLTALLIVVAGRSGSFNAPAYPAMAVLGIYAFARVIAQGKVERVRTGAVFLAWSAVVVAGVIVGREALFSRAAQTKLGEEIASFAHKASIRVGNDPVAFVDLGDNHAPLLMGRHPGRIEERPDPWTVQWVIRPLIEGIDPVVATGPLTRTRAGGRGVRDAQQGIGLYRSTDLYTQKPPADQD